METLNFIQMNYISKYLLIRVSPFDCCRPSLVYFCSGPRLDVDPDVVAALDEDFDFDDPENLLEDDFVAKANCTLGAADAE